MKNSKETKPKIILPGDPGFILDEEHYVPKSRKVDVVDGVRVVRCDEFYNHPYVAPIFTGHVYYQIGGNPEISKIVDNSINIVNQKNKH